MLPIWKLQQLTERGNLMSIFEIINGTTETTSTPATSSSNTTDLAAEVAKLSNQIAMLAMQTTDPTKYNKMMAEIAEKEKKEKAARMFDSMTMDEQKQIFASFKKTVKAKSVSIKDIKDEIAQQIIDIEAMGVTDKAKQKALTSVIMGFDVTNDAAIKAERDRRNEEALEAAAAATVEDLDSDYKMFEVFAKMFK